MLILKGSFCYEGTKGKTKALYSVQFNNAQEALTHISRKFDTLDIVDRFWYGYHILNVNKVARKEETAILGYDKAEEILDGDFPDMKFDRDVLKNVLPTALLKLLRDKNMTEEELVAFLDRCEAEGTFLKSQ